jgi:hypothetical protein
MLCISMCLTSVKQNLDLGFLILYLRATIEERGNPLKR